MVQKVKAYFKTLEELTTEALDRSAEEAVRAEKRNVALVIAHIAEISRRKAELECGYKSIFDYCTTRLQLSEGSVARRLQVANVSRQFPQLLIALAENRISLTVAGLLAPHVRDNNVDKLLSDCAGKSRRAVEEYLVALKPKPTFKPSIRKRPSPSRQSTEAPQETQRTSEHLEQPSVEENPSRPPTPSLLEPAEPEVFNFRFAADGEFKAKFERLAEVLGVENPLKNMAEVFDKAIDISLEKKDPKRKLERRLGKERKRGVPSEKPCPGKVQPAADGEKKPTSRYILLRGARTCPRTSRPPMPVHSTGRDAVYGQNGTRDRARASLRDLSQPRGTISQGAMPSPQPIPSRALLRNPVHTSED